MEKLKVLRSLLAEHKLPRPGMAMVVDVGGANALMREIFFGKMPKGVTVTNGQDELFTVDGTPVRLRFEIPYGSAYVVPEDRIPPRTCCDAVAFSTLLCCMSKGNA